MDFSGTPLKRCLIGGNWKCNGTVKQVDALIETLNSAGEFPPSSEVVIAVPALQLQNCKSKFQPQIAVCSQDVGINPGFGAYTGEMSAELLVDSGIAWTLTGHSERRVGFGYPGETNEVVGKKTKVAINAGMSVIACIGEMLPDREAGRVMDVCSAQLKAIKDCLTEADWAKVVVAYEPVWAIGTGKVATPEQAEETHRQIRDWLAENISPEVATAVRIIYGGSVKGSSAEGLITCPNIDGFLVGGASLLPEFVDIIRSSVHKN